MIAERDIFNDLIRKLDSLCADNLFVYTLRKDQYPVTLTIKPDCSIEGQMSMLEQDYGYNNKANTIRFEFSDGGLTYKISDGFVLPETIFNKLKSLAKKLHYAWLQVYFRENIKCSKILSNPAQQANEAEYDSNDMEDISPEEIENSEA